MASKLQEGISMKLKFAAILAALPLFACGVGYDETLVEGVPTATAADELHYEAPPPHVLPDRQSAADAGNPEEDSYLGFVDPRAIPQDPIPANNLRPLAPRPPLGGPCYKPF